ncbi:YidB family protein [Tanticharoenia sakaeratensis]|nr:YidB family protein [Tanticharoenia sakaeratensis]
MMSNETLTAKVTGKIIGSDDDQSGLMSELNAFLKAGGLQTIETRARDKGLSDMVSTWRNSEHPESTSAETIRSLFTQSEIEAFTNKTGQNESGAVSALATQLPRAIHLINA